MKSMVVLSSFELFLLPSRQLTPLALGLLTILCGFIGELALASPAKVENFLFIGGERPHSLESELTEKVEGVQIVYSWKSLEPEKDRYDFSEIERDWKFLSGKRKKLWVQLQDRFFRAEDRLVPEYLLSEKDFGGGLARQKDNPGEGKDEGAGWVSRQWDPRVRARFQKLLRELAKNLDGKIYGINLPETSADIDLTAEMKKGFSCDSYFHGTLENLGVARESFSKSYLVQYVNFWPCEWDNDRNYMGRIFSFALEKRIGLGGPDIIPYRKGQMKNAYPFFHRYKGKLSLVAFAVQEPTRTYTNPQTGKRFTNDEFLVFGRDYLGANLIFWSRPFP